MIESVEELEQIISTIEANLNECDRLSKEYLKLPWWAVRRRQKNLDRTLELLRANGWLWARLNEGINPDLGIKVKTKFVQNGRTLAEGEL